MGTDHLAPISDRGRMVISYVSHRERTSSRRLALTFK
jgi:hypothetical protein